MGNMAVVPSPGLRELRLETVRGGEGFFRAAQEKSGRWSLLTPTGEFFFLKGVHGVRAAEGQGDGALPIDSAARLRGWGFNAIGVTSGTIGGEDGFPFLGLADFVRVGRPLLGPGLRLPDVFDPDWPRVAGEHAKAVTGRLRECRELIGWVTDDRLGWAQPASHGRPALLQLCLSLEPHCAAYHAAWEFTLALHRGSLEILSRAWGVSVPNKGTVRELTRAEEGFGSRGYLRDEARWSREFARRYLTSTSNALRAADPNHLVLGCRFDGRAGLALGVECVYPAVDVGLLDWRELAAASAGPAANPVLVSDVSWAEPDFIHLPTAARVLRLTSLEWMLRRGRTSLERAARHPAVVGYAWGRWQDEPGEQPPFARGLIHLNGIEAREHTELLAQFNARAENLRSTAASLVSP
ncbi:MAG: hypothetical protein RL077_3028 [Verrucomicrobiota bacterium]|jgi:hypothetical protein